jgi:hypothetical protein
LNRSIVVDIANIVQGFNGVRPLPGIQDAWIWTLSTMATYGLALTSDGGHAVQMNVRGEGDEELMAGVLSFARERSAEVLAAVPFGLPELTCCSASYANSIRPRVRGSSFKISRTSRAGRSGRTACCSPPATTTAR